MFNIQNDTGRWTATRWTGWHKVRRRVAEVDTMLRWLENLQPASDGYRAAFEPGGTASNSGAIGRVDTSVNFARTGGPYGLAT